jgi:hypothetical protein
VNIAEVAGGKAAANKESYEKNELVTVTATADAGYSLTGIKVYGKDDTLIASGTSGMTFSMPAANVTVKPSFTKNPRSIAAPTVNAGGSVEVSPASSAVPGATVTLKLSNPDDRFKVASVVVKAGDKAVTVSGSGNERTFTMPEADVTEITVTYETIGVYKVTRENGVSLRNEQSGDTILVTVPAGEIVYAREGSNSKWIKTAYGGYVGWIKIEDRLTKQ